MKTRSSYTCNWEGRRIQAIILEPSSFMLENIQIGCNIVNASRKYGVKRLINLISCMYPGGLRLS